MIWNDVVFGDGENPIYVAFGLLVSGNVNKKIQWVKIWPQEGVRRGGGGVLKYIYLPYRGVKEVYLFDLKRIFSLKPK